MFVIAATRSAAIIFLALSATPSFFESLAVALSSSYLFAKKTEVVPAQAKKMMMIMLFHPQRCIKSSAVGSQKMFKVAL
mgnify:CR=1 FL=1